MNSAADVGRLATVISWLGHSEAADIQDEPGERSGVIGLSLLDRDAKLNASQFGKTK